MMNMHHRQEHASWILSHSLKCFTCECDDDDYDDGEYDEDDNDDDYDDGEYYDEVCWWWYL